MNGLDAARIAGALRLMSVNVASSAFREWFGGSAVVDDQGRPLVVYHGTVADFAEFDLGKTWSSTLGDSGGLGFFFSTDPVEAAHYAHRCAGSGPVMPVYLSIRAPKVIEKYSSEYDRLFNSKSSAIKLRGDLMAQGYDGAITHLGEYVAFLPTQIKSAISNTGLFDSDNPDIHDRPRRPRP